MVQTVITYNPEQNSVAERMNRTLSESARHILFVAEAPQTIMTACYLQNCSPGKATEKTPYEL